MKTIEVTVKDCDPNDRKPGLDIYFPREVAAGFGWQQKEPIEVVLDGGVAWRGTIGIRPPNLPYLHRPLERPGERLSVRDWLLDQGVRHGARIEFTVEGKSRLRWIRVLDIGAWPPGRRPTDPRPDPTVEKRPRPKRIPVERGSPAIPAAPLTKESIEGLATNYWNLITSAEREVELGFKRRLPEYRRRGYLDKQMFLDLACWKSRRPKPHYERNTTEEIQRATGEAFQATDDAAAIYALTRLHGIGLRTATALLHWMRPERFPILDIRVVHALGKPPPGTWEDIDYYLGVAQDIRELAQKLAVDLRTLDRALWAWDKLTDRSKRAG